MKPSNILKTIDNENDIAKLLLLGSQAKANDIKAIAAHLEDGECVIQDSRYDYIPRTGLEFPKAILITSTEVAIKPQDKKKPYVRLVRLED